MLTRRQTLFMLPAATLARKRLTIYLEHHLPARFGALGVTQFDVGVGLRGWQRVVHRALRLADRLHVNLLKLRLRAPALASQALRPRSSR